MHTVLHDEVVKLNSFDSDIRRNTLEKLCEKGGDGPHHVLDGRPVTQVFMLPHCVILIYLKGWMSFYGQEKF